MSMQAKIGSSMDYTEREVQLIECLFRGYQTLGFDTDGDRTGMEMLSHAGIGGHNLDAYIKLMDASFAEARTDMDSVDWE